MSEKRSLHCPNCGANVSLDSVCCPYCRSTLSVTSCPKCFAPVFAGMKHCPDCGVAIDRKIIAEKNDLLCPECAISLKQILVGDVDLCECGTCGGLWLDTDTFENLCEETTDQEQVLAYDRPMIAAHGDVTTQRTWKYMPCPECGELMLRKNFLGCSGIIVDSCKKHGTWFEYKELQGIVTFIQSGGMLKARQREMDKLKEEQQKLKEEQEKLKAMALDQDVSGFLPMGHMLDLKQSVQSDSNRDKPLSLYEFLIKLLR